MRTKRIEGPPEVRFWAKVAVLGEDQCWLWQASFRGDGYGLFAMAHGKLISAHRASFIFAHGPIPNGLWVLHRCDVKACVNPAHLFLGSRQDNMDDMVAKRRHWAHRGLDCAPKGEANAQAKLNEDDVREIRQRFRNGETQTSIAADFPCSRVAVSAVCRRKTWRHVA